jgi:type IV pilus assembly protein PilM
VEFEAQQQVPFPINEVVWNYQLMGEPGGSDVEVLLAAIKADELDEIDKAVRASGFKSSGAEIAPLALFNAFRFNYSDVEGTTLLIDIGARTTNLIFVEGSKLFLRTIKIGGVDLTRAISKEFNVDFNDAERRKIADGFVALGGPYADHEDPVIAGISKVIRNSLTRLHSEIMRTTNFYRSQQGGSAPTIALLSGASAALPFIREFFAEKLNIPIDYFNALRNVAVGGGVNRDEIAKSAHTLGELVGSALAATGESPVALELAPVSVKAAREFSKRKPYLLVASFAAAATVAGIGHWYHRAADIADQKTTGMQSTMDSLEKYSKTVKELKTKLAGIEVKKEPYVQSSRSRAYWTLVFNDLSQRMDSDLMWVTKLEPLSGGQPVLSTRGDIVTAPPGGAAAAPAPAAGAAPTQGMVDAVRLVGLYRDSIRGAEIVVDYLANLRESPYFAITDPNTSKYLIEAEPVPAGTKYAGRWEMILPLPEDRRIPYTK